MNYEAQKKHLKNAIMQHPRWAKTLLHYRKVWHLTQLKFSWVVVGGIAISDHVILTTDIEGILNELPAKTRR